MKEQIKILIDLQRIESRMASLTDALAAVPGLLAALDARLQSSEDLLDEKATAFDGQNKKYRDQELEVQDILARIRASKSKLMAVKNNKEYQALLKEIDELESKNSFLEDDMLEFLEHMDQTKADISAQKASHRDMAAEIEDEKAVIQQDAEDKTRRLERMKKDLEQTTARLSPALMNQYNNVKAAHPDGLAVASVTHAVCSGCHLNIPPQMYNELQKGESIRLCPTCERIIYWLED